MSEKRPEYVTDAAEMMGKGYDKEIYQIHDEAPHNHFTSVPNLVDDMNLSPFAFRLYVHIRRVAGEDGKCWQSTPTLAKACNMGMGTISKYKRELASTTPPLIRIEKVYRKETNDFYHLITITDIWGMNSKAYVQVGDTLSPHETPLSCSETPLSPHERKKNPLKKNPDINNNNISNSLSKICTLYESEIGVITPLIADALRDAETTYPEGWVDDAIEVAARRNARNWSYVEAILKRWKKDGKNAPFQPATNYKSRPAKGDNTAFFAALQKTAMKGQADVNQN